MTSIMNRRKLGMTQQNSVKVPTSPGAMTNCPHLSTKYKLCIAERGDEREK